MEKLPKARAGDITIDGGGTMRVYGDEHYIFCGPSGNWFSHEMHSVTAILGADEKIVLNLSDIASIVKEKLCQKDTK